MLGGSTAALAAEGTLGCSILTSVTPPAAGEFDYVVIGAGSAGCTLVARLLAGDPEATVLVVEAGGSNHRPEIRDFTQSWKLTQPGSEVDWGFKSVPQSTLGGRPQSYSMGKVLGGSSSINGMVWARGSRADYDGWAANGCPGWEYEAVLKSFKRMETYLAGNPEYHGTEGPIRPSDELTAQPALSQAIVEAWVGLGYPLNEDYNGASQEGVGYTQLNVLDGVRQDAFTTFVEPFLGDPRLAVLTGAVAKRILFTSDKRADRVLIDRGGGETTVRARREVILCTGTVKTPQLLMLSGIGDPAVLAGLGIEVVAASAGVGKNLHDHLISVAVKKLLQPEPESHVTAMDVSLFVGQTAGAPRFQVQSYYMRYGWGSYPSEALALGCIHLHPTSRGAVTLASPDPHDAPIIDPGFLGTPEDVAAQLEGYKMLRTLLDAPGLATWLEAEEFTPGPDVQTDEELVDALRQFSEADFHPVGTCRMGPDTDPDTVVDPELRVRGVTALRVAGAAIMPKVTSGNTNAPSMMIGDRCGELLLKNA
jgi:choline dehydrogenase